MHKQRLTGQRFAPWGAFRGLTLTPAVTAITIAAIVVFLVQRVMAATPPWDRFLVMTFGLSRGMLARGFFWQPLSYMFLHGGFFHLLVNLLVIVMFGSGLEQAVGTRRFWIIFLLSGIIGGLGWLSLESGRTAICLGASGGVFGLIGAYAGIFPRRNITLLLFFLFPLTIQAWVLALMLGLSTLLDLVLGSSRQIAYAAHLAGGLAGYLYGLWLAGGLGRLHDLARKRPGSSFFSFRGRRGAPPRNWFGQEATGNRCPPPDLDDLLDKINRHGLSSLSEDEEEALRRYSRRGLDGGAGSRPGAPGKTS